MKESFRSIPDRRVPNSNCNSICFGSAMGSEVSKVGMYESETLGPRFRSIKRKGEKQSIKPSHLSNHAAEISPTRLKSGKSESSVRIVSISRDGELNPVILSPAEKAASNGQQSTRKKKPLRFDAAKLKVKSHEADDISVKSLQSELCTEGLPPKQISEEEEELSSRKLDRRSWVRIAKALSFTTVTDLYRTSRNGPKVSQDSQRGGNANDTPVIEQPKGQEIGPNNEGGDSIPGPIDQASKSRRIFAEVHSKSRKALLKSHRKLRSYGTAPGSFFKRRGIESADPVSSSSSYAQFSHPATAATRNSTTPNYQSKKPNILAEREGTITGFSDDAKGEGEGYNTAISLVVLIIIIGCLVLLSDRFVAVVCTSIWWYLLAKLLKKDSCDSSSR